MFKYIIEIIDGAIERIFGLKERRYAKRIKLPVLKQTLPLMTSITEVSVARARVMQLNQINRFITGAGIQIGPGLVCTLDIIFCRQLTREEEKLFKEAIGNVSVQMSAPVPYKKEE